jgi:hypothetical protein
VRKPGFQVKGKWAKNGLKEQGEKCRNAAFLHEVELLSKHDTKVAAATRRNLHISGRDESCASRSPGWQLERAEKRTF